ncbi:MAG: HAMP domain-containing histidine kinase [Bacteroidia bacterium]|nr:HAMP domain-containing histidine kinase [Bacteroidia bacterium]
MKKIFSSLFWRFSLFFLISLAAFASIYVYITYNSSLEYSQETSQKLNRPLAKNVAKFTRPFIQGEINDTAVKDLFHDIMVINPSVEVYLLDTTGKILTYHAPFGEVKLDRVDLAPIKRFIANDSLVVKGEDPRTPGVQKVFSASKIMEDSVQSGYLYVVLASQEYTSVADVVANSYKMKLATKTAIITLISTLFIGFIVIWFLVRNLNTIMTKVKEFRQGNLDARIRMKSRGEISALANSFDAMADTIVANINDLKSVENLRKELIANVSHDLRTPLTSIQGYAETLVMLKDDLDEESKQKYLHIILSSTQRVMKLVENLFEISKLESNQVQTKKEVFSIKEMLSDIAMKYDLMAKSKSITLEIDMDDDHTVFADIALIERVFQNLLDNAIKHTSEGEKITVSVQNPTNESVEVCIQDTGVGIADDELPYIFDRYKKGNKKDGSGLGLAIVKKILDLHKIEISVQSEVNQGTAFSFQLPILQ